jgi:hypothetical protein
VTEGEQKKARSRGALKAALLIGSALALIASRVHVVAVTSEMSSQPFVVTIYGLFFTPTLIAVILSGKALPARRYLRQFILWMIALDLLFSADALAWVLCLHHYGYIGFDGQHAFAIGDPRFIRLAPGLSRPH